MSGDFVNNGTVNFDGSNGYGAGLTASPINIGNASGSGAWNITSSVNPGLWNNRLVFQGTLTTSGLMTVSNYGNLWIVASTTSGINSTSAIYLNGTGTYLRVYGVANAVLKIGTLTGSGKVDFADGGGGKALTLSIGNDNGTGTFTGTIANSGASSPTTVLGLTKEGSGTQTLSGTNTYTGATAVNGGTLTFGIADSIANSASVTLANTAGVVFNLGGYNQSIKNLSGGGTTGGNITLGDKKLTVTQTSGATYAGVLSGSGGQLQKEGGSQLELTASNTYTGATTINGGTLKVGASGGVISDSSAVVLGGSGTFDVYYSETVGSIAGSKKRASPDLPSFSFWLMAPS